MTDPKHEPETVRADAHQYRLNQAGDLIEALCVVDPETGEKVPVYEPDPDVPGSYRKTERAQQIEAKSKGND